VETLTANRNVEGLVEMATLCRPNKLVIRDQTLAKQVEQAVKIVGLNCEVLSGQSALCDVASDSSVEIVVAAIVGAAGLPPTLAAAIAGKRILLANKEALVMSGELLMQTVADSGAELMPVDSEHNAIFQCLPDDFTLGRLEQQGVTKILLTGSGGPFKERALNTLDDVTPEQACNHPNWIMGKKISVDSATMMNKGLEYIEACWLFGLKAEQIEIVLHPQSIIHSMVQYRDGSILAQMGQPDMRTPIAHALAYPERIQSGVKPLDFSKITDFSFSVPEAQRYPCLALAKQAFDAGQYATTVLNAANEIAVDAFLQGKIRFPHIAQLNAQVMEDFSQQCLPDLESIVAFDQEARIAAKSYLKRMD
jgi:1-deoxy-D-xylulose-5-phosphate reductoisomerase